MFTCGIREHHSDFGTGSTPVPSFSRKDSRMSPRGAPKGNTNALKHGFYAKKFLKSDLSTLDNLITVQEAGLPHLASELALLRVVLLRTFEQASNNEEVDWIDALSAIGMGASRVAGILRTQKLLDGEHSNEVQEAIRRAIDINAKDWK
jgi:hypothetical protein